MIIARTFVLLGIPSLKEQLFAIIFFHTITISAFLKSYLGILIIIFNSSSYLLCSLENERSCRNYRTQDFYGEC